MAPPLERGKGSGVLPDPTRPDPTHHHCARKRREPHDMAAMWTREVAGGGGCLSAAIIGCLWLYTASNDVIVAWLWLHLAPGPAAAGVLFKAKPPEPR